MLRERLTQIRQTTRHRGPVLYWMSRDQRVEDNWALLYAQEMAIADKSPLAVLFCLVPAFLDATTRQYRFMLEGLRALSVRLDKLGIPFFLLRGEPAQLLPRFIAEKRIAICITDFDPLRIKRQWKDDVLAGTDTAFVEIDAHNIVPCRFVSQRQEYGAYTLRKKISPLLPRFLDEFPPTVRHPFEWSGTTPLVPWDDILHPVATDAGTGNQGPAPGESAARKNLRTFLDTGLAFYDTSRNNPILDGQSHLSAYLHFGHLSAQRVAMEVMRHHLPWPSKAPFLEQLIVRRELADNFCYYNPSYDSFTGFPEWARKTLDEHRQDTRWYLYSGNQLASAETHDGLWNAAQQEMVKTGRMHGYMRMYWAKKILEWTESPEAAMEIAIHLNNTYELDGRDPNGYAGIAWSIGGVHDRPWKERSIFGKIRFMSYNGCRSKFSVNTYIEKVRLL